MSEWTLEAPEESGGSAAEVAAVAALIAAYDGQRAGISDRLVQVVTALWRYFLLTGGASVRARQGAVLAEALTATQGASAPGGVQAGVLYDNELLDALGRQMAEASRTAQVQAFGLSAQFERQVSLLLGGPAGPVVTPEVIGRRGVDPVEVYQRPAGDFRFLRSLDEDARLTVLEAVDRAEARLVRLAEDDVMLAARDGAAAGVVAVKAKLYRRVIRPELSRSGSCGLCIAAADRFYKREDLLPIHGRCNCVVLPIINGIDPGRSMNKEDLEKLYRAAGTAAGKKSSTAGADLKRVRVQVNEHGEMGPVLVRQGQKFVDADEAAERRSARRGRSNTRAEAPAAMSPEWLRGQVAQFEERLAVLEARSAAGENVADPIKYHREQIARFKKLLAAQS